MSESKYPVWIKSPAGQLFAIVHEPDESTRNGAVVVMPSAGQDVRAGPQRIYLKAARRLIREGFCVVRLDLAGVGDSATKNRKFFLDSHSTKDLDACIRWATQFLRPEAVYLVGLCAGANVAFRYAAGSKHVSGIVAWSVPMSRGDLATHPNFQGTRPVSSPGTPPSSCRRKNPSTPRTGETATTGRLQKNGCANTLDFGREPYAVKCMDRYLRSGRPAQFVYGSLDKTLYEKFSARFPEVPSGHSGNQCVFVIPEGIHTLATIPAQQAAISMALDWLNERMGKRRELVVDPAIRAAASKTEAR